MKSLWMHAKEWTEVQRLQKLHAMSKKLAGGSQSQQRRENRENAKRSGQRQLLLFLGGLFILAANVDMARPKHSLLLEAIGPVSDLEKSRAYFPTLAELPGPGTALNRGFPMDAIPNAPMAARVGSNGLQE